MQIQTCFVWVSVRSNDFGNLFPKIEAVDGWRVGDEGKDGCLKLKGLRHYCEALWHIFFANP